MTVLTNPCVKCEPEEIWPGITRLYMTSPPKWRCKHCKEYHYVEGRSTVKEESPINFNIKATDFTISDSRDRTLFYSSRYVTKTGTSMTIRRTQND